MHATALLLAAALAASDVPAKPRALALDYRVDLPVTSVMLVAWLGSEALFKKQLAPTQCHWCDVNPFDDAVRGVFHPSREPSSFGVAGPDLASNLVGFGALPAAVLGLELLHHQDSGATWETSAADVLLVLEGTFAGLVLDQGVKFAVGRARPYTIGASPELLAQGRDPADHFLSFFSGHSTWAFGFATAAGTVATLRGYRFAWLTWAVGVPLAATTALLRLAADKHWASDVLVGSAIGAAFGVGIPLLFHRPTDDARSSTGPQVSVAPLPGGLAVVGRF